MTRQVHRLSVTRVDLITGLQVVRLDDRLDPTVQCRVGMLSFPILAVKVCLQGIIVLAFVTNPAGALLLGTLFHQQLYH